MNNLLLYLIQTTTVFSVLYLLYILFLEKLTFHAINRVVLLLLLPVSCVLPLSNYLFPSLSSKNIAIPLFEHATFENMNQKLQFIEQPLVGSSFSFAKIVLLVYGFVLSVYLIRILNNTLQLFVLRHTSTIQQKKGYQLVLSNVPEIFSYFNWIFIPKHKLEQYDAKILKHEKAHIYLKHSWDVILAEVYIALFWFNPLVYAYRKSLKSIHEFQADKDVLESTGVKTSQYMELLMESLEINKPNNLYNYFNQPILKKRVLMITKTKSNHISKLKYILFLPVCVFLISAFTSPIIKNNEYLQILETTEFTSTPPSLFPVQHGTTDNITSHFGTIGKHSNNKGVAHGGIDIRGKSGTPILATADGTINKASLEGDWGNLIIITHDDGYETWYAHLKSFNTAENKLVEKGDIIGYLGNTGKSTAPHLHYEVKQNGKRLNPMDYLK